jgi:hypothetical protein
MWPLTERRAKLSKGLRIRVVDGKSISIEDLPLPLISACLAKADIVEIANSIRLSWGVDRNAAEKFLDYLLSFCVERFVAPMSNSGLSDVGKLHICSAADIMGMNMYTQNLLTSMFNIVEGADNEPPRLHVPQPYHPQQHRHWP